MELLWLGSPAGKASKAVVPQHRPPGTCLAPGCPGRQLWPNRRSFEKSMTNVTDTPCMAATTSYLNQTRTSLLKLSRVWSEKAVDGPGARALHPWPRPELLASPAMWGVTQWVGELSVAHHPWGAQEGETLKVTTLQWSAPLCGDLLKLSSARRAEQRPVRPGQVGAKATAGPACPRP